MRAGLPALILAAAAWTAAAAGAQEVSYAGSFHYASGSYIFTRTIHTFTLQNGLALRMGNVRLDVTIPVIVQNSGAVSLVGGVPVPTGGSGHGAVGRRAKGERLPAGTGRGGSSDVMLATVVDPAGTGADEVTEDSAAYRTSVGDPMVSGTLDLLGGTGLVRTLALRATAKVPINDLDSGVGTGEWDYGVGASGVVGLGRVVGLLDVAYWWYGDLPLLELRDGLSWGLGVGLPLAGPVWGSALLAGSTRLVNTAEAPLSLSLGISANHGRLGFVSLTAGIGLSETAPGITASIGVRRSVSGGR